MMACHRAWAGLSVTIMNRKLSCKLIVVGGVNTDYVVQAHRLPSPEMPVDGTSFLEGPGGKGANFDPRGEEFKPRCSPAVEPC